MNLVEQARLLRKQWQQLLPANDDTKIIDCEELVDFWDTGMEYAVDDIRKFEGQVYRCVQAHTSQDGWEPSQTPALWVVKHTKNKDKPKPFVQPQGAHDAYMKDEVVLYNDQVYISVMDNNAYSPSDYPAGWQKENENEKLI